MENVIAGDGFDAIAGRQHQLKGKHTGAFDRVINGRREVELVGIDANMIAHDRLDLRLGGCDTSLQVEFGF